MKLFAVKKTLSELSAVNFKLPNGAYVPRHFHVTEAGLVTRHFIDCGGVERRETRVNLQLWQAGDHDHRLAARKFLHILNIAGKVIGEADDLAVEVEYQQDTIGRFGLEFDGMDFVLTPKQTDCLAKAACGRPDKAMQRQGACC